MHHRLTSRLTPRWCLRGGSGPGGQGQGRSRTLQDQARRCSCAAEVTFAVRSALARAVALAVSRLPALSHGWRFTALRGPQSEVPNLLWSADEPLPKRSQFRTIPLTGDVEAVRVVVDTLSSAHLDIATRRHVQTSLAAPILACRRMTQRAVGQLMHVTRYGRIRRGGAHDPSVGGGASTGGRARTTGPSMPPPATRARLSRPDRLRPNPHSPVCPRAPRRRPPHGQSGTLL